MNKQAEAAWELHCFLADLNVPYAVIGGIAVQHWGEPRFTLDLDVTIIAPLENPIPVIEQIATRFTPRIGDAVNFARRNRVILVQASNECPIDISLGLPGYEEEVMRRAVTVEIAQGKSIQVCSAEDLIVHKAVAGRPQDLRDIEGIIYRQGTALDAGYVRYWLDQFAEVMQTSDVVTRFEAAWNRRATE